MSQNASVNIGEVYRSVIQDVINQVKEAFLDENIDIDVLQQLKKEWEEKVMQSGAIDVDIASTSAVLKPFPQHHQAPHQHHSAGRDVVAPPPMRPRPQAPPSNASSHHLQHHGQPPQLAQVRIQQPAPILVAPQPGGVHLQHQPSQQHYVMQMPGNLQGQLVQVSGGGQFVQRGVPVQQYTLVQPTGQGGMQNVVMVPVSGQHIPVAVAGQQVVVQGNRIITHQPHDGQHHHLPQLDGDGSLVDNEKQSEDVPTSSGTSSQKMKKASRMVKAKRIKGAELERLLRGLRLVPQVDGGGMDDSSSEDEDEAEDDDDPLKRIADRLTEGNVDDEEQVVEEEPLGSGDDQSDDEDLNTLFDADDVIMCQFEKVHRARSKWKFILKDGIMHIRGKDYCFQKCTGEAEW